MQIQCRRAEQEGHAHSPLAQRHKPTRQGHELHPECGLCQRGHQAKECLVLDATDGTAGNVLHAGSSCFMLAAFKHCYLLLGCQLLTARSYPDSPEDQV